jgi:hypothetical protein
VEGLESSEPWKLATEGLPHFDGDDRPPVIKKLKLDDSEDEDDEDDDDDVEEKESVHTNGDDDHMDVDEKPAVNGNNNPVVKKEEGDAEEVKASGDAVVDVLKKLGSEIMITSKSSPKPEADDLVRKYLPKVTPNGDKLNLFNHSSHFNMQLSPVSHSVDKIICYNFVSGKHFSPTPTPQKR